MVRRREQDQRRGDASAAPRPVPIEDWIDLHGYAPRDIPEVAAEYLEEASAAGFTEVRLVHGRGKGVQRARVQQMLRAHPLVLAFRDAPHGRGGLGATLAWLRSKDRTGRLRWRWRPSRDREAAERIWRALLESALSRADRLRMSAREPGPLRLRFGGPLPLVHLGRSPGACALFDGLERAFSLAPIERVAQRGRHRITFALEEPVSSYLQARSFDGWNQRAGHPEDPILLEDRDVVFAAEERAWIIHLGEAERDAIDGVALEPL